MLPATYASNRGHTGVAGTCVNTLLFSIRDIHDWLDRVADADFYIRSVWPDPTTMVTAAALPEALGAEIDSIDGVDRVDKLSWVPARSSDRQLLILSSTFATEKPLPVDLAEGDPVNVLRGLLDGEVVVGTTLAQRLGLGVGDEIVLETRQGPKALRIAGTTTEYTVGGMSLYMEWDTAKRLFNVQGVHAFRVTARRGERSAVTPQLRKFCEERGLLFQSYAELREMFDRQMEGFLGSVWLLIALVFVVASLGIVNTLTMNVLEQTRELGILRAIGMKRSQICKMVLSQALALGVVSLLPGILAGIVLTCLMILVTYPVTGQPIDLEVDVFFVLGCSTAALVIAVLAALIPAGRAARLQVIQALHYE